MKEFDLFVSFKSKYFGSSITSSNSNRLRIYLFISTNFIFTYESYVSVFNYSVFKTSSPTEKKRLSYYIFEMYMFTIARFNFG